MKRIIPTVLMYELDNGEVKNLRLEIEGEIFPLESKEDIEEIKEFIWVSGGFVQLPRVARRILKLHGYQQTLSNGTIELCQEVKPFSFKRVVVPVVCGAITGFTLSILIYFVVKVFGG